MKRRDFIQHSLAASAILGGSALAFAQTTTPATSPGATEPKKGTEPNRGVPFEIARVKEFVGAGHGNLPRVKEMLAEQPKLVFASYDWGSGDFETALGGAAHTGRREVALHLLDAGARIDAFCAAMLGETEVVTALLRLTPSTATTRGPHNYSLLYHAGYSGKVALAEAVAAHLRDETRARDFNLTLQTASLRGHAELVAWLLKNGVKNPNVKNFQGKTPLDLAVAGKHTEVAKLLRDAGGTTSL